MERIKIAEVVTRLEYGGVESVILNYINNMDEKRNFEFHIITQDINAKGCIKLFEDSNCIVHIVTHKRKSVLKNVKEINDILKKEKFDIVHSHMNLTNFYVLFLARLNGCKNRIAHVHSALITKSVKQKLYYKILTNINQLVANKYIMCGVNAGVFYFGRKKVDAGKVKLFPNAIDISRFKFNEVTRDKIRKEYNINKNTKIVGHVGRFMEVKNHIFLLKILKYMIGNKEDVKLMLVGDGELLDNIKDKAQQFGIIDSVIFVGNTDKTDEFYQAMDVFVLPSFYEGIPVVSIEAQCSNLPCVLSNKIDMTCKINENVKFLPLDSTIEVWSRCILEMFNSDRNQDLESQIRDAGYDIKTEANLLAEYYKNCLEGKKDV